MDFDLNQAIAAHGAWKRTLRRAIVAQEQLDAATIGKHDRCPLGQWLHGPAREKYGHLSAYRECAGAHAIFHLEAGKIALLVNQRRFAEAEFALNPATAYEAASTRLATAMSSLWRDAVVNADALAED